MPPEFFETFNTVTVVSGLVSGFLFGAFAWLPLVRRMTPKSPPPPSRKAAFWLSLSVIFVLVGSIVVTFYLQQFGAEIVLNADFSWRAVGRLVTFLVYLFTFSLGVAVVVWREYTSPHGS